jgi:hypothetical protein
MPAACATVIALAACAGSGAGPAPVNSAAQTSTSLRVPAAQIHLARRTLPSMQPAALEDHRGSWMLPEAKKSQLLYVADEDSGDVDVYSYPKDKLVGTLTGFDSPAGLCTDTQGEVYILNGNGSTIDVYAHGGSQPERVLDLPGYPELNCSSDKKTGNLAVGVLSGESSQIAVFAGGAGTPVIYQPSGETDVPGCAYDDKGNLFCDAAGSEGKFLLFELPKGSTSLSSISANVSGLHVGPDMWDGQYLTIGSGSSGNLVQLALSGSTATEAGTTTLNSTSFVWQFWLVNVPGSGKAQAKTILAPTADSSNDYVGFWAYPAGGNATKTLGGFSQPDGVTVSVAPR